MRHLFALLAAFFAGLWLNERFHRQRAEQIAAQSAPKPLDRRSAKELIPALKKDIYSFDTKSSLLRHFNQILWKSREVELTPLQFKELSDDLIVIASFLANWDEERDKMRDYNEL